MIRTGCHFYQAAVSTDSFMPRIFINELFKIKLSGLYCCNLTDYIQRAMSTKYTGVKY